MASDAVIDYVSNWTARLQSRLYAQFKDDPSWNQWCAILGKQAQDLEDAMQSLLALLNIDAAAGVQLDVIGRIVGQPRSAGIAQDDATYRLYLKARIAANRSEGDAGSLYSVFGILFPGAALRITSSPIKAFTLTIGGQISDSAAQIALEFLHDAKEATDRAILEWQETPDSETFTFGVTTYCQGATSGGATSMLVDTRPLVAFPATGQVTIDDGLPTAEVATYTSVDATGTMHFSAALTQAHAVGAALELVGDPGLGFGDDTNPATGGAWAGAADADSVA